MSLVSQVEYATSIGSFLDLTPDKILHMIKEVKSEIGKLQPSFLNKSLREVLAIIERGAYGVNEGDSPKRVNLTSAKMCISSYKQYSEGGCQSCRHCIPYKAEPKEDSLFQYCKIIEKTPEQAIEVGGRKDGFSPMVKLHFSQPCDRWKPHIPKTLDKVLAEAEAAISGQST